MKKLLSISLRGRLGAAILAAALALAGCGSADVVGKFASTSFASLAEASAAAGNLGWIEEEASWSLSSPAGDQFLLSADFSGASAGRADAALSFDAAPFLAAGLDLARLPASPGIAYSLEGGRLVLGFELGSESFGPEARKSMAGLVKELVKAERERIGYHAALDHYGIALGGGNMFEWAKDLGKNDKDLVFVLDPAPFLAAGIDPAGIEGWVFAKVEVKAEDGKMTEVDKLLRPFDLR